MQCTLYIVLNSISVELGCNLMQSSPLLSIDSNHLRSLVSISRFDGPLICFELTYLLYSLATFGPEKNLKQLPSLRVSDLSVWLEQSFHSETLLNTIAATATLPQLLSLYLLCHMYQTAVTNFLALKFLGPFMMVYHFFDFLLFGQHICQPFLKGDISYS